MLAGNHEDGTCRNGNPLLALTSSSPDSHLIITSSSPHSHLIITSSSPHLATGDATKPGQRPCSWYGAMVEQSVKASEGARYSCGGSASKGCIRNDTGVFGSESLCMTHCTACENAHVDPCENGGRCVAPSNFKDEAAVSMQAICRSLSDGTIQLRQVPINHKCMLQNTSIAMGLF
jgi:hypothetical protein